MRLEQLEYLLEVAAAGSIVKASRKLHITQQNISYALKTLEEELGVKIFDRSSTGLKLTPEGHRIHQLVEKIIQQTDQLQTLYQPTTTLIDPHHREDIYCLTTPSLANLLFNYICQLKPLYPKINFHLQEHGNKTISNNLMANPPKYQFCFMDYLGDFPTSHPLLKDFHVSLLKKSPLVLIAANDHPALKLSKYSLRLIEKYPAVFFNYDDSDVNDSYYDYLIAQNYKPNTFFFTNSPSSCYSALTKHQSIGVTTEYIYRINRTNRSGLLNVMMPQEKLYISHLLITSRHLSPGGHLLLQTHLESLAPSKVLETP